MIVTPSALAVEATLEPIVDWQQALRRAIRSSHELLSALRLPLSLGFDDGNDFPVFVPLEFVSRMEPGNPDDPLLRQVLATEAESLDVPGFELDPVGDLDSQRQPGLLQKYRGRVLLVATGSCAVHCRYCFRRQFPYSAVPKTPSGWQPLLDEIELDDSIEEVILSGGDPLMLSDRSLAWLVDRINRIAHIQRLRIHSRMPVVIPQRVDQALLNWLESARPATYFVLHVNHANEIDASVVESIRRLRSTGATLLNQAVLLRGVNDSEASQLALCKRLIDLQVLPYYLHQLDRVHGAAHFETQVCVGLRIIDHLRAHLPGYGVPTFVTEQPATLSKTPL